MVQSAPSDTALRVSDLSQSTSTPFALRPDRPAMEALAVELNLSSLRKLSFEGTIGPMGSADWQLTGRLGATVVQPCVVTLEPVTTRIDVDITRSYLHDFEEPEEPEAEMPDDDSTEPLVAWIDPAAVMVEALALAVPDYPRKDDAALAQAVFTEPGQTPMTDEEAKPFAGLADLKAKLEKDDDTEA